MIDHQGGIARTSTLLGIDNDLSYPVLFSPSQQGVGPCDQTEVVQVPRRMVLVILILMLMLKLVLVLVLFLFRTGLVNSISKFTVTGSIQYSIT